MSARSPQSVRFWTDDGFEVVLADDYDALVEQLETTREERDLFYDRLQSTREQLETKRRALVLAETNLGYADERVNELKEQLEAARTEIGHLRDELVGADMWLERKTIHQEKQADKIAALEEQLEALTSERDLAMKAHHEALVAHGYEKQQKHGIEHEKARLQEQLEAERKAWRKALDSALQYVPLKDHDFIEAIVSNPASAQDDLLCRCGGKEEGDHHFDRSICACGAMHYYCNRCGYQCEPCDSNQERTPDASNPSAGSPATRPGP